MTHIYSLTVLKVRVQNQSPWTGVRVSARMAPSEGSPVFLGAWLPAPSSKVSSCLLH